MSGSGKEWIFVILFFAIFLPATLGEIYWLIQSKTVQPRRAMILVFSSNFVTITLGFVVTFLIFGVLLAVAWDQNTEMPGGETATWGAFLAALAFPILLMAGVRRLLISALRIEQISRPTPFAIASSLLFFALVVVIPILFLYFF